MFNFLEENPLTVKDYWNLLTHIITAGLVVASCFWLDRFRIKVGRDHELGTLVASARFERDVKEHKCLSSSSSPSGDNADETLHYLSAKEIRDQILAKKMDPKDVVVLLAKRCREYARGMHRGVNAIAEELYDEAYQTASTLTAPNKQNNWFKDSEDGGAPPLFGVPISVKECIAVEGCYSTGGLACRLQQRMQKDGLVVELLRKGGAIPLCTGNTIQIMMLPECYNRIWGRSRNPWDLDRTPGGSSGGDAALVALGGVPLAICSDVAGSIRIPASFCGVVGFKPTSGRLSAKGNMKPRKDNKNGTGVAIPPTVGPIARTVEDCALFLKAVCIPDLFAGDLNIPPLPFDDKAYQDNSKLKVGYFKTDEWFEPCTASKRALEETITALEKAGHICVPFELPTNGWYNYGLLVGINAAEGNFRSYIEALEGEDIILEYTTLVRAANVPNWLRWLLVRILDERRGHLLGSSRSGGISVFELWKKTADLMDMRSAWSDAFREAGIDALVFPGFPIPAIPHGISADLTSAVSYMFLPNLLLWPAGVVPITTVKENEQHYRMEDLPSNQRDKQAKITASKVMPGSAGLPISVSIMTPGFQDEKCLRVMREIETLVNFKDRPTAFGK